MVALLCFVSAVKSISKGVGRVGGKETDREKIDARKHFWCRNIVLTPSGTIVVVASDGGVALFRKRSEVDQ
jgi:chorismate-pyruvate lyase